MEIDQLSAIKEINGINLANYIPHQSNYDSIIYIHKRLAQNPLPEIKEFKVKKKKVDRKVTKEDKAVSCEIKEELNGNGSVLQQTVKFAKDLAPLMLPKEGTSSPVYYTVKTCKCRKKKSLDTRDRKTEPSPADKRKSTKIIYRKEKMSSKESYSERSITHSSQNSTLDDVQNQSLCTVSELSREKFTKKNSTYKKSGNSRKKISCSESFEGLATKMNEAGDTKIKIHVMNEKERLKLCESIQIPVLNSIKEYISELNDFEVQTDVKAMQKHVISNAAKLDRIEERLENIEKMLKSSIKTAKSPRKVKLSHLEQLGEDLAVERDSSDDKDNEPKENAYNSVKVFERMELEDYGGGEAGGKTPTASVGVKTDGHRVPARFCWTDATTKF